MSRHTSPTYPMLSPADDSGDEASGVEDSLRGTAGFGRGGRGGPVANDLFGRPAQVGTGSSSNAIAFATTPDSALPPSMLPPPHSAWHSPRGPMRTGYPAAAAASTIDETPEAGPSTGFHLGPPRIERQAPVARAQAHISAPPLPVFAAPVTGAGAGNVQNLFARPPPTASTASTGVNAFGSPTWISISGSFSFAPRGAAGAMFALPTARIHDPAAGPAAAQPQSAAPHTPVRSARPTTATTNVTTTAIAAPNFHHPMAITPSTSASAASRFVDAAALAAERRIRQARASRGEDGLTRRSVSFSPVISTPDANAGAYNAVGAAPPPPHRATGGAPARTADSSLSHLGRAPRFAPPPGADSFSTDSTFARPTATRLFAPTSAPTADTHTASFASTASEPSASWSAETSSTAAPPTVRLRKWDGSQAVVPAYLLSDSAEQALEEQLFDHAIAHFDPGAIVKRHAAAISGTATAKDEEVDAVQSILDIQLGLSGLHGWYGHTFQAEGSRKRRRSSSGGSNDPIVVYDAFGRVRGTITLPNYKARGGPPLPLPSPRETHALRTSAAAAHVLATTGHLVAKEDALTQRESFQAKQRPALLKGLQNAYLDAAAHPRRIK